MRSTCIYAEYSCRFTSSSALPITTGLARFSGYRPQPSESDLKRDAPSRRCHCSDKPCEVEPRPWSGGLRRSQMGRLSRNGSTAASFSAIPQTSVVFPPRIWKIWVYFHSALEPSRAVDEAVPSTTTWSSLPRRVVDVHRRRSCGRLGLAGEELQHLRLALIGPGPLAVTTDVPDHRRRPLGLVGGQSTWAAAGTTHRPDGLTEVAPGSAAAVRWPGLAPTRCRPGSPQPQPHVCAGGGKLCCGTTSPRWRRAIGRWLGADCRDWSADAPRRSTRAVRLRP